MRIKPDYFSRVVEDSQRRWKQLQADPGLKGPWDRLFKQVQQPDHVISELLQNADDAGATWARVYADDSCFIVEHNGADFDEDSLRAISSFAQSNKTILHTIGQWGIGFKSVFSLGPRVEILSPSLAFAFDKDQYITPKWLPDAESIAYTRIRIWLESTRKYDLIQEQIRRWQNDGLPLLFFNHIEKLEIGGDEFTFLHEPGPTPTSQWVMKAVNDRIATLLLVQDRVRYGDMPDEAQQDIQSQLPGNHAFPPETTFPIALVAGNLSPTRIYVVLPTKNIIPSLPFSLSAPFIQDPGRTGILMPGQSPANAWFLEKLGELAARTLLEFLQNTRIPAEERTTAYTLLLPDHPSPQNVIDADLVAPLLQAFAAQWNESQHGHFLTVDGSLASASNCLGIPAPFLEVWPADVLQSIFAEESTQQIISSQITPEDREHLARWCPAWKNFTLNDVFQALTDTIPPRPQSWENLARLWRLGAQVRRNLHWWEYPEKEWPLFPVQGQNGLYPKTDILPPLSDKEKQFTDDELRFLLPWINLVDREWWNFLNDLPEHDRARELKNVLSLPASTSKDPLFKTATEAFFDQNSWEREDGLRWAWIAARLNIPVPATGFLYLCRDGEWRSPGKTELLGDISPDLEEIVPKTWLESHALHEDYWTRVPAEYRTAWNNWISSQNSRLRGFIRLAQKDEWIDGRAKFEQECRRRGGHLPQHYPRKTDVFLFEDYDFSDDLWHHWEQTALSRPTLWSRILYYILKDWEVGKWEERILVKDVFQYSNNYDNRLDVGYLFSYWIIRLREKPCVLDEHGNPRLPHGVFRRNSNTEALRGTVTFLHPEFDAPKFDALFQALGIPNRPGDADVFVQRLRAWIQSSEPPIGEIGALYDRISLVLPNLAAEAREALIARFQNEPLLLGDDGAWHTSRDIYQRNPERLPGIITLHPDLPSDLSPFWNALGVPLEPSWTQILAWLRQLPKGKSLGTDTLSRLRQILKARPAQTWKDTAHWLNGAGEWVPVTELRYKATYKDLQRFFPKVRRQCADVSALAPEQSADIPLQNIEQVLEYRPEAPQGSRNQPTPAWMQTLARCLRRVVLQDADKEAQVRGHALRLEHTTLRRVKELASVPYLQHEPVGPPFPVPVLWYQKMLYSTTPSYEDLTREIQRVFPEESLKKAIHAMWKRQPDEIERYFQQEFTLRDADSLADTAAQEQALPTLATQPPKSKRIPLTQADGHVSVQGEEENPPSDSPAPESSQSPGSPESHLPDSGASSHTRREAWEIFWAREGFTQQEDSRWVNPLTGEWVQHQRKAAFRWTRYTSDGIPIAWYWDTESTLEKGIEMPFETWSRLQNTPERVVLVLWQGGEAEVLSGRDLQAQINREKIQVYPATYRLRLVKPD